VNAPVLRIARILDRLLDIGWYLTIVCVVLAAIFFLVVALSGKGFPVFFTGNLEIEEYGITVRAETVDKARTIERTRHDFTSLTKQPGAVAFSLLMMAGVTAFSLTSLHHTRRLVKNALGGNVLTDGNVRHVRWLAILYAAYGLLTPPVMWWAGWFGRRTLDVTGATIRPAIELSSSFEYLFNAGLILLVAEVIRLGKHFRDEQELTI
jgi:Protein of unknown function (DUF2975)